MIADIVEIRKVPVSEVDGRLKKVYNGRVTLVGEYHSRQMKMLCFCDVCGEAFQQKAESLFRGRRTRCRCTWPTKQTRNKLKGHTCVDSWDMTEKTLLKIQTIRAQNRVRGER